MVQNIFHESETGLKSKSDTWTYKICRNCAICFKEIPTGILCHSCKSLMKCGEIKPDHCIHCQEEKLVLPSGACGLCEPE